MPKTSSKNEKFEIDGKYNESLQAQVAAAREREKLLNAQLQLKETRFAPGSYVKFAFTALPEFLRNVDTRLPLVLGALLPGEI